ncbi:MAG: TIGR00270 family protein [Euryarchaeota archaeon]|nr:TIGR00270 family protein [Euryarchaeota archaeon]
MRCEICGTKIVGKPLRTKIEGSVMLACPKCAKLGKIQREPPKKAKPKFMKSRPRRSEPAYEVLEDYNIIVREGREKKVWSREDLAEKIYEKVSVINRIESGRMMPDIKLAKKLERTLNIKLLEKTEETSADEFRKSSLKGATIGDIARIKKG